MPAKLVVNPQRWVTSNNVMPLDPCTICNCLYSNAGVTHRRGEPICQPDRHDTGSFKPLWKKVSIMYGISAKLFHRAALAAVLLTTIAACSSPGQQTASLDTADQAHGWVDAAVAPATANQNDQITSNADEGN